MYFFLINLFFLSKRFGFGGARDSKLDGLVGYRRSRTERQRGSNVARDFSRWVHRDNKAFPAKISTMRIPVLFKKKKGAKKVQRCQVDHQVIHFSDWFRKIMANCSWGAGTEIWIAQSRRQCSACFGKIIAVFHPTIPSTPNQLT